MPFGRDYHPRIADPSMRERAAPVRGSAGRNLVHAADHNARVTLEALRRAVALTRQDLAEVTGLTAPGITNIIRRLVEAHLIRPVDGGRAARFAIEPNGAFALGVDPYGDVVQVAIVDLKGRIVHRERRRAASAAIEDVGPAMRTAVANALDAFDPALRGRLLGVGVATPFDPAAITAALPGSVVTVERSSVAAALGERLLGAAPGDGSFVHVLFGREVRAGLMIRGHLFHGVTDRAGRIGQMRTGEDGILLDEAASTADLQPLIDRHFDAGGSSDDFLSELDDEGRAIVERWVDRAVVHFVDAVIAVSGFLAPSGIFVGGRLPRDLVSLFTHRFAAVRSERMSGPMQPQWLPEIVPATLGPDCVLLGAAMLPFLETLLPDPRDPPEVQVA
ncbi:ROK family transcriptional regulator [Mesorhizobium sp. BR1-1-16]|uniref:ROK family protein n=1 Tax=Mesorhizobium sp. BR1-1-16 TaxID=2876653 RepID=UPI001CC9348D|nr:ROK family transcriptional regulator [Mesorhizobium sp. BR1-1-16]MBZ9936244.1 ROK family transcriptional regulator [Mesorhizobium sp. BR1-1-16]